MNSSFSALSTPVTSAPYSFASWTAYIPRTATGATDQYFLPGVATGRLDPSGDI
jgi:hypothetical protein